MRSSRHQSSLQQRALVAKGELYFPLLDGKAIKSLKNRPIPSSHRNRTEKGPETPEINTQHNSVSPAEKGSDRTVHKQHSTRVTPATFINNARNELSHAFTDLKNRFCYCMKSPTTSLKAIVSMFLYAGSTAVLASCALGTIASVSVIAFPAWFIGAALGGAALIGAGLGIFHASEGRSLLPEGGTHWTDFFSLTNYWRRVTP